MRGRRVGIMFGDDWGGGLRASVRVGMGRERGRQWLSRGGDSNSCGWRSWSHVKPAPKNTCGKKMIATKANKQSLSPLSVVQAARQSFPLLTGFSRHNEKRPRRGYCRLPYIERRGSSYSVKASFSKSIHPSAASAPIKILSLSYRHKSKGYSSAFFNYRSYSIFGTAPR